MTRSLRLRVPSDPRARAYWYLGWDKRNGHLPCGAPNCAECVAALAATDADFQRFPLRSNSDPIEVKARTLVRDFYVDPVGSGFDETHVP
ncbi:hypothetical protein LY71_1169 [Geodermatophilus tzadiensis]|uniref:Uncharacterized protein n=1 Tax=Geodermatophilus tzadiensis TaxID=1137988 RepID=A0A2T0TFA5_9ACTN|nr:hypothetical protein LY71_1169 [Geodermatophilus tzadiensis]